MTRTLVFIAFAGFILAVACIAGALALGGEAIANHHWGRHWVVNWDDHLGRWTGGRADESDQTASGTVTREIPWPGGDRIEFDVPGDVQYTQGPGPAKLTVTGSKDQIDHIELSGSELKYNDDDDFDGRVTVVMTAPDVRHFSINGDNSLAITGFNQDDLGVDVSGNGKVSAKGKARAVKVDISGNGDIDLSGLQSQSADAQISGSGRASMSPSDEANLSISGSGEIDLLTHPPKLTSDVSGSGRIVEGGPPPSPSPPATPPKPK
jgi:hypothetical protein